MRSPNFKSCFLIGIIFSISTSFAQLNTSLIGYLDVSEEHGTKCNDIWGYTDELGNEYALVGTEDGVAIVDVTDAANPEEIAWINGLNSVWRDLKTYGDYAYVTTEADEGLLIIDLSPLPASTSLSYSYYYGPTGGEWLSAHNLYQDDGYVYIFGAGRNNGGVIILDVASDPLNPVEVGTFDNWYCHDGFVMNDTGYFAHIYDGHFSIVDLTDKSNPVLLGMAITPTSFAHNIWLTADGNYAFTTDEVSGGYLGSFDVSDPSNIIQLDKIQSSPGQGIVPHNSHVLGNYLFTSYYADGLVIHDISQPHNLVEVANYDTSPLSLPQTVGCWGAYPFLNSGNILATDREEGLFIIGASLNPGCYLEGNVTDAATTNPLSNVTISINGSEIQDKSNVQGDYATGIATSGSYNIEYFKPLYYTQTVNVGLSNGVITNQDIALQKIPAFSLTVQVLEEGTMNPIEGAQVRLEHPYVDHEGITDVNGELVLDLYYQDNYQFYAGKWGYITGCYNDTLIHGGTGTIQMVLSQGLYDDFTFDFGWSTAGDADRGHFEREIPVQAGANDAIENPATDSPTDCGGHAWLTGNGSPNANTEEVNGGDVTLISPVMDLTTFTTPHINYALWYFCFYGLYAPDDTARVYLFNGTESVLIDQRIPGVDPISTWTGSSIDVNSYITVTNTMQLFITIGDSYASENVTELGFDNFSVTEYSIATQKEVTQEELKIYPNPTTGQVFIKGIDQGILEIYDLSGQLISNEQIRDNLRLDYLEPGFYIFVLKDHYGEVVQVTKMIKK